MSCEAETIGVLRESGHKMTPQRMLILSSLRHAPGHMTASDVYDRVRKAYPYVDISTVYRTLTVFKELHFISETDLGGGDAAFEWVGTERHHHLICRECNEVTELPHRYLEDLGERLAIDLGFRADIDHFAIFGTCKDCRAGGGH
ncbi:MAG: Fur family transcriptional regulator [Dehalococcoidia bacterium]